MIPHQHTIDTPYFVGAVHCYSTEINGELVLLDTGPPTLEAVEYLRTNLDLSKLKHVIVTHCHLDHFGLVHWLEQETDATIYIPFRDALRFQNQERRQGLMHDLLLQIGFEADFVNRFMERHSVNEVGVSEPQQYQIIEESDLPAKLGITPLACPGHSQSDLVLQGDSWAVSGDVLLKEIFQTPLLDVDLLSEQRFRNYHAYCDSLVKLVTLKGKQILPGHRHNIESIDACLLFYLNKLLERAGRVKKLPLTMNAVETVCNLLGDKQSSPFISYLKASEILFLRDFLAEPELLCQATMKIGLYSQLADSFTGFISTSEKE